VTKIGVILHGAGERMCSFVVVFYANYLMVLSVNLNLFCENLRLTLDSIILSVTVCFTLYQYGVFISFPSTNRVWLRAMGYLLKDQTIRCTFTVELSST